MGERIVSLEDMALAKMVDARLQNILSGQQPGDNPLDEDLSALITQMNELVPEPYIPPEMADAQIAGILDAFAGLGPSIATVSQPPRRTWAARLGSLSATPARKIAAASLALTTSFSGLAYAGALPDPLQRKAADLAGIVGIDIPHPDDPVSKDSGSPEPNAPATGSDDDQTTLDDESKSDEDTSDPSDGKGHGSEDGTSSKPDEDKGGDQASGGDDGEADDDVSGSHGSGSDDEGSDNDSDSDSDGGDSDSDEDSDGSGSGGSGSDSDSDSDSDADEKDSDSGDDVELENGSDDQEVPDPDDAIDDGSDADDSPTN